VSVSDSGVLVYEFNDLIGEEEKRTSQRLTVEEEDEEWLSQRT
jgi:hypothetical protein